MDGFYKATVVLKSITGVPADDCVNTFYFEAATGADTTADDADAMSTLLQAFYNDIASPATKSISDFIGGHIDRTSNACSMQFYFDEGPGVPALWGSPDEVRSWTIGVGDTTARLPAEVAAVLSFHGDLTDVPESAPPVPPATTGTRPAARRRGRVYLGPLNTAVLFNGTGDAVVTSDMRTAMKESASELLLDSTTIGAWVVASKADDTFYPIAGGWVDYAFDTQRRRGVAATSRETWT